MQESKQRKIYNKTSTTEISDEQNIARSSKRHHHSQKKKSHFSNKIPSEESKKKIKKSKKWQSFNNTTLKHINCPSTYVGSQRLTKQVGFLTKGKISDSISRLEKIIPSNLKARADQDLHRILRSGNQHYVPSNYCDEVSPEMLSPICNNHYNSVNTSPVKCIPSVTPPCQQVNFISKINKMAQTTSSLLQENRYLPDDNVQVSVEIVTETLYPVIAHTNKQIFKGISNLGILKKELLSIKQRYSVDKKTPSSSSNNESSQDLLRFSEDNFELNPILTQEEYPPKAYKEKFELNPVLTQDPRTHEQLMHIFPDHHGNSLSSIEEIENDESDSSPSVKGDFDYKSLEQKSVSSSDCEDKRVSLIPRTPSSSGSPVWIPVASPVKFAPNYTPTPKLYYRQKMF